MARPVPSGIPVALDGSFRRADALESCDPAIDKRLNRRHVGGNNLTIHDDCACEALPESAAELGRKELEIIAQHVKQGGYLVEFPACAEPRSHEE